MQSLELSCAVRRIYTSLGAKGLNFLKFLLAKIKKKKESVKKGNTSFF